MATEAEIQTVRVNTNTVDDTETYSDTAIGALVDELGGVEAASAAVWRQKAAAAAELVDVSEAGSSRKLSDLHKNATAMAAVWDSRVPGSVATKAHAKVHRIVRVDTA